MIPEQSRNISDLATLAQARLVVSDAMRGAHQLAEIEHPQARWSPGDLLEALADQLADIDALAARIAEDGPHLAPDLPYRNAN